jgi:hypothetical protein
VLFRGDGDDVLVGDYAMPKSQDRGRSTLRRLHLAQRLRWRVRIVAIRWIHRVSGIIAGQRDCRAHGSVRGSVDCPVYAGLKML